MKTLTQYENSKKTSFEEAQIDEGLFGKIFGALFKKHAKLFDAVGSALGEEKGKRLKKFEEELFKKDEKAAEKAIKDNDAKKAIEYIENGVEDLKKSGVVKEEDEWTFKALQAFMMNAQHAGDEEYKKVMQEYIDKCKQKGGNTTKKDLESVGKNVNKASEQQKEEETLDPVKTLADKHKSTLQDLAKMGNLDNKILTGIEAKVKKALESLKDNNDIINESDELKKKLSESETAQSLFSTILVAYYGLKNLKIVSTPEDLGEWIKLIEDTEVEK